MTSNTRNSAIRGFIITTFVGLYLIVSVISTIHVIEFFELSNPKWLAISLALAFEVGAAASLSSLIILEKMNKFLVWTLFIVLTAMQAMGNTFYAYTHIHNFQSWSELFGLIEEDVIYQKRILSVISGAILPLVSLGFIKSLVDYIKPEEITNATVTESIQGEEKDETNSIIVETLNKKESEDIKENAKTTISKDLINPEVERVNSNEKSIQKGLDNGISKISIDIDPIKIQ